jgi:hypothetical protein
MPETLPAIPDPPKEKIIGLLEAGASLTAIWKTVAGTLTPAEFLQAVDAAGDHFRREADVNHGAERGKAIARLNNLYLRSLQIQDFKICLAAQKELNRLLDLTKMDVTDDGMVAISQVRATWESVMAALQEQIMAVPGHVAGDDKTARAMTAKLKAAFDAAMKAFAG